jgi:hypothetical protein
MAIARMVEARPNQRQSSHAGRVAGAVAGVAAAAGESRPKRHWLDALAGALEQHKAQYWADVEALATEACPPIEVFDLGREWLPIGKELRQTYSRIMRQAAADSVTRSMMRYSPRPVSASETFLRQWPV